ncbi:hypothetical protein B5X24_HaOG211058 [Helicoverpa armigera]|uniref:Uncharacterized protein n=1 Tax=Helicoverpa armigera TaxID=29058 RepID=A0A2W1BFT2_HELAM|nr:hypothetical protein B5X24_HaOG211058 [Helicoverpa armigera]
MSHFVAEVPEVVVKPGKMINLSSSKMKALAAALVLMLYVYLLIYFKTIYLRSKRLDDIMAVALKTEREMLKVHTLDKKLALQMAQVDRLYEDY